MQHHFLLEHEDRPAWHGGAVSCWHLQSIVSKAYLANGAATGSEWAGVCTQGSSAFCTQSPFPAKGAVALKASANEMLLLLHLNSWGNEKHISNKGNPTHWEGPAAHLMEPLTFREQV